jgi:2-polyprenyl-3-methyl-5-hydroxy-6-metoxy-1,4-benzoquinol methylase
MDLGGLSSALTYDPASEIWRSERAAPVAYPEGDHATCFALEDSSFWFRHRNRCILAAVTRTPPGGFILDVGGGNGFVSRALIDAGFPSVLLEPGPEGALNARRTRRIPDVICATLEEAALNDGSVPAVGMFDVLEHIENDAAVVEQLHQVLRPNGHVYLTVPSFNWLWSGADVDAMHFRRYTRETLAAVFARHFDIVYMTALFGRMVPALFLGRTLPYALGFQRKRTASQFAAEHRAGGSAVSSLVERALAHESARVAAGETLKLGSTILLVARRR